MTRAQEAVYRAALLADDAWRAELLRRFGKRAGTVRYTSEGRGALGSELRKLYVRAHAASQSWLLISRQLAGF